MRLRHWELVAALAWAAAQAPEPLRQLAGQAAATGRLRLPVHAAVATGAGQEGAHSLPRLEGGRPNPPVAGWAAAHPNLAPLPAASGRGAREAGRPAQGACRGEGGAAGAAKRRGEPGAAKRRGEPGASGHQVQH
jgi:hypothetical protein